MPDTLTESFCERCGTRYEFAAPSGLTPMRRTRGVIAGLKNYILSQDSLSDSMEDARRAHQDALAATQLDAFHSSFRFCFECRQYSCTNCWNDDAGSCQSCHPLPAAKGLAQRFAATSGEVQPAFGMPVGLAPGSPDMLAEDPAWPATDLTEAPPVPLLMQAEPEPVFAAAEPEPEPEPPPVFAAVEPEPEPEPPPVFAAVEPEPEPELVFAAVEPEPEPEPVVAAVEPEPEPYRPLRPIGDSFVHFPRAVPESQERAAATDPTADEETLAARRAQLNLLGLGDPGQGPVGPARPVALPYRSSGAETRDPERTAEAATHAGGAFWDASAREVAGAISQIGVRSCGHCELSLSATARFCRRCGTPQSQSA